MKLSNANYLNHIQRAVVGFSGGADSTALLHYLKYNTNIKLTAVHVNHQLQPNSIEWEMHCRDFCKEHDISSATIKVVIEGDSNVEEKARNKRFEVFKSFHTTDLFLGHHADDQNETFLLKMMRGSGVRGLKCMEEVSKNNELAIHRPLLNISKSDILAYCVQHNLSFVQDSSNESLDFDRNVIRNKVFPVIQEFFPNFSKAWGKSFAALQDANECLNDLAWADYVAVLDDGRISIAKIRKLNLSPARIRNMLQNHLNSLNFSTSFQELTTFSERVLSVGYDRNLELSLKGATKGKLRQKGKILELRIEE